MAAISAAVADPLAKNSRIWLNVIPAGFRRMINTSRHGFGATRTLPLPSVTFFLVGNEGHSQEEPLIFGKNMGTAGRLLVEVFAWLISALLMPIFVAVSGSHSALALPASSHCSYVRQTAAPGS
jgi:hypothetical protein